MNGKTKKSSVQAFCTVSNRFFLRPVQAVCTGAPIATSLYRPLCTGTLLQRLCTYGILYRPPVQSLYSLSVQTVCTEPVQSILYRAFSVQFRLYRRILGCIQIYANYNQNVKGKIVYIDSFTSEINGRQKKRTRKMDAI